jgi:ubiquinone/menaquinone biosynthesis C-methylase UbiE
MEETEDDRDRRHRLRTGFDSVADRYAGTRAGYPEELVEGMIRTAGLGRASSVLEIGCGTGQLTRSLTGRGFAVTAVDLSPAMVARARADVDDAAIEFVACAFEDYSASDAAFDLVVSATACHWVDPEIMWSKSARLLRLGGWIALLETSEAYDEPLRSAIRATWMRHVGHAWVDRSARTIVDRLAASSLFDEPVEHAHVERRSVDAAAVIGVEETRATWLAWDESTQASFDAELHRLLAGVERVELEQHTLLAMARVTA